LKISGWIRTKWFWIGFVLALYTVLGFLVVPWAGKTVMIDMIREKLGREARLTSLRFNPYTLAVTAQGFAMLDKNGGDFVRFDELYVNFQTSSLFRWGLTFKDIRLVSPYVLLEMRKDGSWNFSDLLTLSSDGEPGEEKSSLIRLLIQKLRLETGEVDFVDRTRPTAFEVSLAPLTAEIRDLNTLTEQAGPYSLKAVTGRGEVLEWTGTVALTPVQSSGRIHLSNIKARTLWRYIRDQVGFEIRQGTVEVESQYAVSLPGGELDLRLTETDVNLDGFRLGLNGEEGDLAALLALKVSGASFDLSRRQLRIPSVSMQAGGLNVRRGAQGEIDWMKLLPAKGEADEESTAPEPASPPFQVRIDQVRAKDFAVTLTDSTTQPEAVLETEAIDLTVRDFTNKAGSTFDMDLRLRICKEGEVAVKGTVGIDPLQVKTLLEVARFPVPCVQPYLNSVARLEVDSGLFNLQGDLAYSPQETAPDLRFTGTVSVDSLNSRDRLLGERFIAWDSISVSGIDVELLPGNLRFGSISTRGLYGKVVIAQDGSVNLADVFRPEGEDGEQEPAAEGVRDEEGKKKEPMPMKIGVVKIDQGSADFQDLSLVPQVSARIRELNGEISGLSSENLSRADVALKGKVGGYGTVSVNGQINPISSDAYTDLHVVFGNVELTTLSPYSGKFTGYVIDEGKLSLDLKYKLANRKLHGENSVYLDRFVFGNTTDSPDAVNLPVKLAVALLKDVHGVIDVNLPVRGDMDDPEFSLGGVILKALLNLITKTAASPFTLLGGLVGMDGESMSYVAFSSGSTSLSEEEKGKIEALAGALKQRPALRLEVRGTFHPVEDGRAIREERLENQLKRAHGGSAPSGEEEAFELLEALFIEQFGNGEQVDLRERFEPTFPASHPGEGSPERETRSFDQAGYRKVLRDRLIDAQPLEEAELRQLAMDRAVAVKDHLVQAGGVDDVGIFILEAKPAESSQEGRIHTGLSLTGR